MDDISTTSFRIANKKFAVEMFRRYGAVWVWISVSMVAVATALAIFHDSRWVIVVLMIVFLVAPAVLAWLYFYHGLKPVSAVNVVEHRVAFGSDGMAIIVYPKPAVEEDGAPQDTYRTEQLLNIGYDRVAGIEVGLSSVSLPVDKGRGGFLCVPAAAFEAEEDFKEAMDRVAKGIRRQSCDNLDK